MFNIRNYTWVMVIAGGILAVVFSNTCCKGKAAKTVENEFYGNPVNTETNHAMGDVAVLTDANFAGFVQKGVVLVDFWATWCRPCLMQSPIIDEVSKELKGKIFVGKLDVDANPMTAGKYNIQSIPTLLIFKNGIIVSRFLGVTSKETLINELKKHI